MADFFEDVPPDKANITLHQLLTHSSGLPQYVYAGDFVKTSRQQAQTAAFEARLKTPPEQNIYILIRTTKLFTPFIKEYEDGESYYGYDWAIEEQPEHGKMIWHDGATDSQNAILILYGDPENTTVIVLSNRIDRGFFKETFYGSETGLTLGNNILKGDFSQLPDYAH